MLTTESPFPQYFDTDGKPLDNGLLYFGLANQNPETNPITVYWDAAGTQPAAQPIMTMNGYAVRNGTPARVYINTDYSLSVKNKTKRLLSYSASSSGFSNSLTLSTQITSFIASIASSIGSSLVGFFQSGSGSVLRTVQSKLRETISPLDLGAVGDGVANDTAAISAAMADGRQVDLLGLTYAVNAQVSISGTVICANATLKFTGNVTTAVELLPGANLLGKLNIDVTTITCTNGILCNGSRQPSHNSAQRCDTIWVKGNTHATSTNGLMLDATVAGAGNKAWLQYLKLRRVIVENFNKGLRVQASQATLALSYVNANVIDELTLIGCKRSIEMDAASGSDVSSNFIQRYIVQYGAVAGSFPTAGIALTGRCGYNRIDGFIYDWDHVNTAGPIVSMDASTFDNFVVSSAFSWEVSDAGLRNRHLSAISPAQTNIWAHSHGRGLLGNQENTLAHFSPSIGTLTSANTTTGTAVCNLATGSLTDVQKENQNYAGIAFAAGTGVASFAIEFRSTTQTINGMSVIGAYFEPGFLPYGIDVQIDTGIGYITRASFKDVQSPEVFVRLDAIAGTDVYNGILGVKLILNASDTRTVRLRQVTANGSLMKTFVSRGGDRIGGDLRFPNGVGPVLVSPDTTEWRLVVSNVGVITAVANPVKTMTYF